MITITEEQYNYFNEIDELVNGSLDGNGEILESGLYSEPVYELKAPLKRDKDGMLYISKYQIRVLNKRLYQKLVQHINYVMKAVHTVTTF